MKQFAQREVQEAKAHAAAGGQALHVCATAPFVRADTAKCFVASSTFAHLFDQNRKRLEATARRLGVRVVLVEKVGQPGQHVDLCGRPLTRAIEMAAKAELALPSRAQLEFLNERLGEPWK